MRRRKEVTLQECNDLYPILLKQVQDVFGEADTEDKKRIQEQMVKDKLKIYMKDLK